MKRVKTVFELINTTRLSFEKVLNSEEIKSPLTLLLLHGINALVLNATRYERIPALKTLTKNKRTVAISRFAEAYATLSSLDGVKRSKLKSFMLAYEGYASPKLISSASELITISLAGRDVLLEEIINSGGAGLIEWSMATNYIPVSEVIDMGVACRKIMDKLARSPPTSGGYHKIELPSWMGVKTKILLATYKKYPEIARNFFVTLEDFFKECSLVKFNTNTELNNVGG